MPCLLQAPPRAASRRRRWRWPNISAASVDQCRLHAGLSRGADPDGAAGCRGAGARAASALRPCQRARSSIPWALCRGCARARWPKRARWARVPIFIGGTGLYFTALTEGLADIPAMPPEIRAARARAAGRDRRRGIARSVWRRAIRKPPPRLRPSDPQRVLRAWEVFEATGRPLAEWQRAPAAPVLKGLQLARICARSAARRAARRHRRPVRGDGGGGRAGRSRARWTGSIPALPAAKLLGLRPLQALAAGRLEPRPRRWTPPSPPRGNSPSAR